MRWRGLRGAQLRFYAALGFLLWSVLPHFSAYVHVHADEDAGHDHRSLSKSQVELAQRLAVSAGSAFGEEILAPSFGLSDPNPAGGRLSGAGAALSAAAHLRHAHIQDDANATLTPWVSAGAAPHVPPVPGPKASPSRPRLRAIHAALARGPPVLPS